ncbi:hypothetical protein D3C75_876000 [compost metagenome]
MDLDVGVLRLELVTDLFFQLVRELLVVQLHLLARVLRVWVALQQRNVDDAGLEVVAHQAPHLARLEHVVAQGVEAVLRAVVGVGDHLATGEAFLGDLAPAHAGAPQRLQPGTVDTRDVEHFVMDLPQGLHVVLVEDVAIHCLHRNAHGVAEVGQVVAVLHHLLDERVLQRDHLLEAGGRPDLRGLPEQEDADQYAQGDDHGAIVEDQAFEQRGLVLVMRVHGDALPAGHGRTSWSAPCGSARCTPPCPTSSRPPSARPLTPARAMRSARL